MRTESTVDEAGLAVLPGHAWQDRHDLARRGVLLICDFNVGIRVRAYPGGKGQ